MPTCLSWTISFPVASSPACSSWLRANVYGVGAKVTVHELMKAATGKPLSADELRAVRREQVPGRRCQQRCRLNAVAIATVESGTMNAVVQKPSRTLQKLQAHLRGLVGKAIEDFGMIAEGDRVMVCLSGGKDSYTLLDILMSLQRSAPVDFELIAVNLDQKQPDFPAHVLPDYLTALGVPFRIIEQDTYSVVKRVIPRDARCAACARACAGVPCTDLRPRTASPRSRSAIIGTTSSRRCSSNMFFGGKLKAMAPKLASEDGRTS